MSVKERYGTMMDNSFGGYYDLFRRQKALSSDTAVTMETLFDGTKPTAADRQMIRKMVSLKRVEMPVCGWMRERFQIQAMYCVRGFLLFWQL